MTALLVLVLVMLPITTTTAWIPSVAHPPMTTPVRRSILTPPPLLREPNRHHALYAFGGFGGDDKNKKKKEVKLKPKQQWDRFLDMKKEKKIRVAVQVSEADDEWLEIGNVRSKEDKHTEYAVARQRALIAEHARRLFPLQISARDTVNWAYWEEESEQWVVLDKEALDNAKTVSLEKVIGFEGRPDPSSGFYCVYNEGRLVNDGDDARPSSKRLK